MNAEQVEKALSLSYDLGYWRAERPDEWTMDRFIRKAEELEARLAAMQDTMETGKDKRE
jgi:hypothetical protein